MAIPDWAVVMLGPALCAVAAACHWWQYRRTTRGGAVADATVVAVVEEEAFDSYDRAYRPTVAYRTAAGQDVQVACAGTHDARSRPDVVRVGERVRVLYHPDRPEVAILARRYQSGFTTLAVIAALWGGVGAVVWLSRHG